MDDTNVVFRTIPRLTQFFFLSSRRRADSGSRRRGRGQDLAPAGDVGRDAHTQGRTSVERVRMLIGDAVVPDLNMKRTSQRI